MVKPSDQAYSVACHRHTTASTLDHEGCRLAASLNIDVQQPPISVSEPANGLLVGLTNTADHVSKRLVSTRGRDEVGFSLVRVSRLTIYLDFHAIVSCHI